MSSGRDILFLREEEAFQRCYFCLGDGSVMIHQVQALHSMDECDSVLVYNKERSISGLVRFQQVITSTGTYTHRASTDGVAQGAEID